MIPSLQMKRRLRRRPDDVLPVRKEFICQSCNHLLSLHIEIAGKPCCQYQPNKKAKCGCSEPPVSQPK